jgi:hypothetical protein
MNEWVGRWPDSLVSAEASLDREFEERLRDSSGLAFSIAYGGCGTGPMPRRWRKTRLPGRSGVSASSVTGIGSDRGSRG